MIRLAGEDLPIDCLGLAKPPRLVMPDGNLHGLVDGHLRHSRHPTFWPCRALFPSPFGQLPPE
jgi:hypothetical protein